MAIKAQKVPPGKLSLPPELLAEWLQQAAEALGVRLRSGEVPRSRRRALRALLVQAFEALAQDAPTAALFRAVDQAGPPGPRIPRPARIGLRPRISVVDPDLVSRVFDYEHSFDDISARAERFLAATGGGTLTLTLKTPSEGEGAVLDMEFTEG